MSEILNAYNFLYTPEERKKLIGEMLKLLRNGKKYSQKEVADLIGVSTQAYSAYENGRNEPSAEMIVRLSLLYGCQTDVLLQRDNYQKDQLRAKTLLDSMDKDLEDIRKKLIEGDPKVKEALEGLTGNLQGLLDVAKQISDNNIKKDMQ